MVMSRVVMMSKVYAAGPDPRTTDGENVTEVYIALCDEGLEEAGAGDQ
jgi:hypothetical protein